MNIKDTIEAHKHTFNPAERLRFWIFGGHRCINDKRIISYSGLPIWKRLHYRLIRWGMWRKKNATLIQVGRTIINVDKVQSVIKEKDCVTVRFACSSSYPITGDMIFYKEQAVAVWEWYKANCTICLIKD